MALLAAAPVSVRPASAGASGLPSLRRGVNLHHLLNWPDTVPAGAGRAYVWPPFQGVRHQLADAELVRLKAWGFDFLRVTLDPALLVSADAARWPGLADHVAGVVSRLVAKGFAVVLDLHPVAVQPALGPEALMRDGAVFARYVAAAARLAERLAPLPGAVALELMNEPRIPDPGRWQAMLEELHGAARSRAPRLPLVLTGTPWSEARGLTRLDTAPFRGSAVLYTFHAYEPHAFTHQGVPGDEAAAIAGLAWPVTAACVAAIGDDSLARAETSGVAEAEARTRRRLDRLGAEAHGPRSVAAAFDHVADWARERAIAPGAVILGEFGCVEAAHGRAVPGRFDWLASMRRAAEARGFPWAYWAYRGEGGMALVSDAGVADRDALAALGLQDA